MKKLLILLLIFIFLIICNSNFLFSTEYGKQSCTEIMLTGMFYYEKTDEETVLSKIEGTNNINVNLDPSIHYFLLDNFSLGLRLSTILFITEYERKDDSNIGYKSLYTILTINPRYLITNIDDFIFPYFECHLGGYFLYSENNNIDINSNGLIFVVGTGLNFNLHDNIMLISEILYNYAVRVNTSDTSMSSKNIEDIRINLGISLYY